MLDLRTGVIERLAHVKSFKLPKEAGDLLAYHIEAPSDDKDSTKAAEKSDKKKTVGAPLVLRHLPSGLETRYESVTEYVFSEDGGYLAYATSSQDGKADGMVLVTTSSGGADTLMSGEGEYRKATFDKAGALLAFLSNRDGDPSDSTASSLYLWRERSARLDTLAALSSEGIPEGWWISMDGALEFSEEGSRLFFGTAPQPDGEEESDDERAVLDVWNWRDPLLQPMQIENLDQDKKRTYRAVVHLDDGHIAQLADEQIPSVQIGRDGDADFAVANTNMPYRQRISWDWPRYNDVYGVNVTDGSRRLLVSELQSQASLSPQARYLTWWDRDVLEWMALPTLGGDVVNLSDQVPYALHNELHDWPYKPNAYGAVGWTENDAEFLVYDAHDIWALDPAGIAKPRSITDGMGRADNLRFRYVRLDPEEKAIDPNAPMLLYAFDYGAKASGFYQDQAKGARAPKQLVMMDSRFGSPRKAKEADRLLFTRETFEDFPDLWTSGVDFSDMQRLSDANPQQTEYRWGDAELFKWTSLDGVPLKGILYKPDGFDPRRQYPMMVYFYEKLSDRLHHHRPPATSRSSISFSFYVSRGYLVFVPDIPYKAGYPGESALNAVVPGVTKLINMGFVQADNIGVQGHSWGGYQIRVYDNGDQPVQSCGSRSAGV